MISSALELLAKTIIPALQNKISAKPLARWSLRDANRNSGSHLRGLPRSNRVAVNVWLRQTCAERQHGNFSSNVKPSGLPLRIPRSVYPRFTMAFSRDGSRRETKRILAIVEIETRASITRNNFPPPKKRKKDQILREKEAKNGSFLKEKIHQNQS